VWQPADVAALTAHIDFFPTLAELAGIPLKGRVREQVEGRSLVRLLRDPRAEWTDRTLVTHVGRWEHGKASESKYLNCSIRNENWQMVSVARDGRKAWQLFDLRSDPGTARNVIAEQPQVGQELEAAYDRWWEAVQSGLVNESAVGPEVNPFKALYWKQYGGGPDEEIRRQMDPTRRPGSRVFPAGPRTMNR
jgi:arylsulfatase